MAQTELSYLVHAARTYFAQGQQQHNPWNQWLSERGLVNTYGFGWVEQPLEGHEKFRGALCIPYFNGTGERVTQLRFRHPDGSKPKYDAIKGQEASLYLIQNVENTTVYLTEGELDAALLTQIGYPAVGVPGATNFKEAWRWLFRDCEKVLVVYDGDEAGQRASARVARLLNEITKAVVVDMPKGKDVTELQKESPLILERLLQ